METELKNRFSLLGFTLESLESSGYKVIGNILKSGANNTLLIYENKSSLRKSFNALTKCIKKASNASNSAIIDYLNFMILNKKRSNYSQVEPAFVDKSKNKKNNKQNPNQKSISLTGRSLQFYEILTKMHKLFKKDKQRMEETINLILKLLDNLIKAPTDKLQSYRSIRRSKERFRKTLFANSESKKLVVLTGFLNSKDGKAVNNLAQTDLKFIRADLAFAYAEYKKQYSKQ